MAEIPEAEPDYFREPVTDVPPPAPDPAASRRPSVPKLVVALRNYSFATFVSDAGAGITVGLVALPLAMAFAIASGLPPEAGVYCAVVTGFLISALGGSMVQIGGPTGAFVVVVSGIVAQHGVDGLFMCTMLGGVMLVVLGATGMGSAINFIPRPVVVGFTNGIAIVIASTQIRDFFGLTVGAVPGDFAGRMMTLAGSLPTLSYWATAVVAGDSVHPRPVPRQEDGRAGDDRRAARRHAPVGGVRHARGNHRVPV